MNDLNYNSINELVHLLCREYWYKPANNSNTQSEAYFGLRSYLILATCLLLRSTQIHLHRLKLYQVFLLAVDSSPDKVFICCHKLLFKDRGLLETTTPEFGVSLFIPHLRDCPYCQTINEFDLFSCSVKNFWIIRNSITSWANSLSH